jgi:hypothetical protein
VHGTGLVAAQLLDERDALLQLRLALLELLDLRDDRVQPLRFLLGGGNIDVELRRLLLQRSRVRSQSVPGSRPRKTPPRSSPIRPRFERSTRC